MNTKQRIVSIAAALMLIISLVSSVTFSAVEANHDCIGESCPICIRIRDCENTLKNLVFTVSGSKAAMAVVPDRPKGLYGILYRYSYFIKGQAFRLKLKKCITKGEVCPFILNTI